MKIPLKEAQKMAENILSGVGFSLASAQIVAANLIEANLVGKSTHGIKSLLTIVKLVESKAINLDDDLAIISESKSHLFCDGKNRSGYVVVNQAIERVLSRNDLAGISMIGIKDMAYATGYVGAYAKKVTDAGLIFLGFTKSPGGLVPYGAIDALFGTNPITFGAPVDQGSVILDMASSEITWSELLEAVEKKETLRKGIALDKNGSVTQNPTEAIHGGLLPIAGHKGSGLALIAEILIGSLLGSNQNANIKDNPTWGAFFVIISPQTFVPLGQYKDRIEELLGKLKKARKSREVDEIYYPGERSQIVKKQILEKEFLEIEDQVITNLKMIIAK